MSMTEQRHRRTSRPRPAQQGRACGRGRCRHPAGLVRKSRHRAAHNCGRLLDTGIRRGAAYRERHAQHGPRRRPDQIDPDLINAGKMPITELPGASYFHHADSFAMMRGGHLDVCVLGAYQVSEGGDLANWHTGEPGAIPAVGGAMDLAIGAKSVFVMMTLFAKDGPAKLVPRCTYPLTGVGCVDRIYTDYATIMIGRGGAVVTETFGASVAELQARLEVTLRAPSQDSS